MRLSRVVRSPHIMSLGSQITEAFAEAIKKAFPESRIPPVVATCNNPKNGDYQCNNAMPIFKTFKGKKDDVPASPQEVAQRIIDNLPADKHIFSNVSIAGPGFINAFVSPAFVSDLVEAFYQNGVKPPVVEKRKVVVDFSSPNIAKQMHVGHLRSTIIGDAICRVLEFCGHEVARVNHVGDWGTQFGMLITLLKDEDSDLTNATIEDLEEAYKRAKKRFDADPEFKKRSQEQVPKLQSGENEAREMWTQICELSRIEFQTIYDRLGVNLEEKGESYYNEMIPEVLAELEDKKLIQEDGGAKCIFVPKIKVPLIAVKKDGGYGYDSTDLAALKYRFVTEGYDWGVYVTDMGQSLHFKTVFEAGKLAQWIQKHHRLDHVGFGLVLGEDGKKFRTRSGESVKLHTLLDEAIERSLNDLKERSQSGETNLAPEDFQRTAETIGYGAIKYADLKQNRSTDYTFSFDRMLDLKGNTAVYILYAYVRIAGIGRKLNVDPLEVEAAKLELEHPSEVKLAMSVLKFPDVVESTLKDLQTNRLCDFLYDTANTFSEFYRDCRVKDDPKQNSRLKLCEVTARVMKTALNLLGINTIDRI